MMIILAIFLIVSGSFFLSYKLIRKIIITPKFQLFGDYASCIKTSRKVVALTYDDGPNPPFTKDLIDLLEELRVKATFFVIGQNVEKHPEIAELLISQGHELGNHSYSHVHLIGRSLSFIGSQIEKTDSLLRDLGLEKTTHFRSPFGFKFLVLPWILMRMNRKNILWNIDPKDYEANSHESIVQHVLQTVSPGSIILLHDGGGDRSNTVKATEIIVHELRSRGYEFKTISDLLRMAS